MLLPRLIPGLILVVGTRFNGFICVELGCLPHHHNSFHIWSDGAGPLPVFSVKVLMKKFINSLYSYLFSALLVLGFSSQAHATETIPTDLTTATGLVTTGQATAESYASWGIFVVVAIVLAMVGISWFRAARIKR